MSKTRLVFVLAGLLVLGGYLFVKKSKRNPEAPTLPHAAVVAEVRNGGSVDSSVPSARTPHSGEGASARQDVGVKPDSGELEKQARYEGLSRTLGNDSAGKAMRNLLTALSLVPQGTASADDAQTILEQLRADPEATMDRLMVAMERLGTGPYWDEKWAALTFMADLNVKRDEFMQFTLKEFTTILPSHSPNRTEQEIELGTVDQSALANYVARAHYIYISGSNSPAEALRGTVQGIQAHADPQIKRALAAQFTRKFPEMADALKTALSN